MKHSKLFLLFLFCIATLLSSCNEEWSVIGSSSFYGKVVANPTTIENGDELILTLSKDFLSTNEGSIDVETSTTINGKEALKSISYHIDGKKVAESNDKANDFRASYRVKDLPPGEYSVTATCNSNFKKYTFKEHITSTTIIIVE